MQWQDSARHAVAVRWLCIALAMLIPQALAAEQQPPRTAPDGLELKTQTKQRLVYVRPGASFSAYHRVSIQDPSVEFSQQWLRDYNNDQRDPSRRITSRDLDRAKKDLSAQFRKFLVEELQGKGGYQVTDERTTDVLELRPALVNIEVNAPDLMSAGSSVTYVRSAGR